MYANIERRPDTLKETAGDPISHLSNKRLKRQYEPIDLSKTPKKKKKSSVELISDVEVEPEGPTEIPKDGTKHQYSVHRELFKKNCSDKHSTDTQCNQCGKILGSPLSLKRHSYEHRQPRFHCPRCKKGFYFKHMMLNHVQAHNGPKFKCSFPNCGRAYSHKEDLTRHSQTHGNEEWHCTTCNYWSKDYRNYKNHIINIHTSPTKKCKYCPKLFTHDQKRARHQTQCDYRKPS